jgi:hypothetical protein
METRPRWTLQMPRLSKLRKLKETKTGWSCQGTHTLPPTPSFPVKTHTPHYSPGQLKGEYRRKMVKEVLPELMDLYVLSLRLVLTLANLLADSLKLESAPLMRFGGVLVEKGKALVGNERADRLAEGAKALVGKFEALREKKARYEFR